MNIDPFNPPTEAETRKEIDRLQDSLKRGILKGGKRVLGTFLSICGGLVRYALHHKIGHAQALDEAMMALPLMFPVKVTDLRAWITLCEQTGIPHVPASDGPMVSMAAIEAGTDGILLGDDLTIAAAWIEGLPASTLWRWQCCAPEALKTLLWHGRRPDGRSSR